jgi:hypothetical protein
MQFGVEFLPAWQIETAASPGGPGDYECLFASEIGKVHDLPLTVGDGEIRSDAGVIEGSAKDGNFAEAVDVLIRDDALADFVGEAGEVEPVAVFESFGERDANVGAAGALGFDLEFVDAREVLRLDPEVLIDVANFIESDGVLAEQDGGSGGGGGGEC